MGHISMPEAMDCNFVGKSGGLAYFVVGLLGTSGITAAKRESRGAAYIIFERKARKKGGNMVKWRHGIYRFTEIKQRRAEAGTSAGRATQRDGENRERN